jgi:hypothetical protein
MVDRDGGQHDPKDMICSKFQGKKGQNHVNTLVAVEHLQEFLKSTCHPSFFWQNKKIHPPTAWKTRLASLATCHRAASHAHALAIA